MKKLLIYVVIVLSAIKVHAQNREVDSLKLLLTTVKTDTGRASLLFRIGSRFGYGYAKNDSALWYLTEALTLSKKTNNKKRELDARESIGRYFYSSGNYKGALEILLQQLNEVSQLRDTLRIYYTLKELMKTHRILKNHDQQMGYAKKAKALLYSGYFKDSILINNLSTVYMNHMASVYDAWGKPDSGLYYWNQSYLAFLKTNQANGIAVGSENLADAYASLENYDSALFYFRMSIPYAIGSKRFDVAATSDLGMARIMHKRKQEDSAFFYAYKALLVSQDLNDPLVMDVSLFLSQLYQRNKQYDSAYLYLQNYVFLNDSLNNRTNITQAYTFAYSETMQQQKLEQEKKEAQQEIKNQIKFYILISALIIFSFIAFILTRNIQNKRKAHLLLLNQKEEIQNALSELKSTQAQLIQSEKMASLGELTAGIAHEIQNPLNFVNNFSEVSNELIQEIQEERNKEQGTRDELLENELLNDIKQNLEKINHHGKRADAIVKGMLQHSQSSTGKKEPTDINALCDEYLRLSYHGLRAKDKDFNATIQTDFDNSIGKINIIPQDIGRVLLNLFNNAFYAVNEKSHRSTVNSQQPLSYAYKPTISSQTKKLNDKIEIKVSDNGNGIPQNIVDKIFQPFFTTKPTGQGTGLGLSLAYDIITKEHNGTIKVESKEGERTTFIITIPNTN